ncbi:MAG: hypothetical protein LAO55_06715 [Acidobacteriia bacterium]|nr:hypothetical protein [Terriglobia bacterium]
MDIETTIRKAAQIGAICLSIGIALGQQQTPPPEVDQALRARVTEFLQLHVDGNFRKAYDMVAEDTKDEYFNSGKALLKDFKIDGIKYNDDFTKAAVTATMSKNITIVGQDMPITMPSTITWKIENGKWVWYSETKTVWGTPMGPPLGGPEAIAAAALKNTDKGVVELPKLDEKTMAAAAQEITQRISVDKKEVTLAADKPSEDKVVFHNGMNGGVQLELTGFEVPGLTAKLEQTIMKPAGNVAVVFHYEPGAPAGPRDPVNIQLTVQPLNQIFTIRVNFAASK